MAPSTRPPEEQPKVTTFNPLVLDRTVIAVPLLKEMQEDLKLIEDVEKAHPNLTEYYNSGLEFNEQFPGGAEAALAWARKMLETVAGEARKASEKRLTAASGEQKEIESKRDRSLNELINTQRIGDLQPGTAYSFAVLHASVIRRLLVANERVPTPVQREKPITRIHPKRFEIIIDLNLEYPGGREAARKWVLKNIEAAKELEKVRDAGQEVHFEKDQLNSQYVFARLEARAIQRLVLLDMEAAKPLADQRSIETKTTVDQASAARFFTFGRTLRSPPA